MTASTLTRSPVTPEYRWNVPARRYIGEDGRFVPNASVREATDTVIDASKGRMASVSQALVGGQTSLADWQTQMATEIKLIHMANASAAHGGWAQMAPADWQRVSERISGQYAYLANFANQIQTGEAPLNGALLTRAELYGEAARPTYEAERRRLEQVSGMTEERNVLGAADHCDGCLDADAEGWVPIGTLTPIGERDCLVKCHCGMEYREGPPAGEDAGTADEA